MSAHGTFRRIAAMHNFGSYRRCSGHATSPSGASVRHECRVGPGNFITRFRHGSLALASLNLACRNLVPTFPQRSPPSLLTTAACGGLRSTPDCRPRRTFLHLSYSCAAPCGPAILVTQDPKAVIVASQQNATRNSFDYLVSAQQERFRYLEAERLGGREIDDEIELGRLLDRDVARLRPAENFVDIVSGA